MNESIFHSLFYLVSFWILLCCRKCKCSYSMTSSRYKRNRDFQWPKVREKISIFEKLNENNVKTLSLKMYDEQNVTIFNERRRNIRRNKTPEDSLGQERNLKFNGKGGEFQEVDIKLDRNIKEESNELQNGESKLTKYVLGKEFTFLEEKKKCDFDQLLCGELYDTAQEKVDMMRCLRSIYSYINKNNIDCALKANSIYTNFANSFLKLHFQGKSGSIFDILKSEDNSLYIVEGRDINLYKMKLKKMCTEKKAFVRMDKENFWKLLNILKDFNITLSSNLIVFSRFAENLKKIIENHENFMMDKRNFHFKFFDLLGTSTLGKTVFYLSSLLSENLENLQVNEKTFRTLSEHTHSIENLLKQAQAEYSSSKKALLNIFNMKRNPDICSQKMFLMWYFNKYEIYYESRKEGLSLLLKNEDAELEMKKNLIKILQDNKENLRAFKRKFNLDEGGYSPKISCRIHKMKRKTNLEVKWNNAMPLLEKLIVINKISEFLLSFKEILGSLDIHFRKLKKAKTEISKKIIHEELKEIFISFQNHKNELKLYTQWILLVNKINDKLKELEGFISENIYISGMIKHSLEQCNILYHDGHELKEEYNELAENIYLSLKFILVRLINNNGVFLKDLR